MGGKGGKSVLLPPHPHVLSGKGTRGEEGGNGQPQGWKVGAGI